MTRRPRRRGRLFAATAGLILATTLAASPPSFAKDDRAERRGNCSGPSEWKLDVHREDGGTLRLHLEVEGGKPGQKWHVFLSDDGAGVFAGSRTSGKDGRFSVQTRTADRSGKDKVRAAANNLETGETCSGRVTL
jgi:hypothetical protein